MGRNKFNHLSLILVWILSCPLLNFLDAQEKSSTIVIDLGRGVKMEMVLIQPGEFLMGSPSTEKGRGSDETQHSTKITEPFYIGKYEVTQQQWKAVMGENPSYFKGTNNPVEKVSYNDCQEFIARLNRKIPGGGFKLPTEAEWEYAARAGTTTRFYWGDDPDYTEIEKYAWHKENSGRKTHPVGKKKPNPWGLYDTAGNVWEYCFDYYQSGDERVYRGGSCKSRFYYCRSANRSGLNPEFRSNNFGFRCAKSP